MSTDPVSAVQILPGYWHSRLDENANTTIFHQWHELEKSGSIDNFRILAEGLDAFREGWFFADSDTYKWLDAAARIYASYSSEALKMLIDDFVVLLAAAQESDGYLFTYNQIHFPGTRWINLQIEHELYCHGHLIEAAVSHFQTTGERSLLEIGVKAANLLVEDFLGKGPDHTPGHEEIEIALLRLYEVTQTPSYLALARQFIEQRGRVSFFPALIYRENANVAKRGALRDQARAVYAKTHPQYAQSKLPPGNTAKKPPFSQSRFMLSALRAEYMQQHRPVRSQTVPVGHAVRYAYLQTATAMLYRHTGDETLLPALEKSWDQMVQRRMYVTGGIGSQPAIEGFGPDFDLNPEYAYAETCAALGCMFWNWEMTQIHSQAKYADLFEWQLYNAASVGMGIDGQSYLYNNPLTCTGGVRRRAWYAVPCCPSNLSRTWAWLEKYLATEDDDGIWLHQYVSSRINLNESLFFDVESSFPYMGFVSIRMRCEHPVDRSLRLRIPSWAEAYRVAVNGETVSQIDDRPVPPATASGYSPYTAFYLALARTWHSGDVVQLEFEMPIVQRPTHPRVKSTRGRVALTRGPLVYCLESIDNPSLDIHNLTLDPSSLTLEEQPDLLGGVWVIRGKTTRGESFTAIPYHLWANRGDSQMTVYIK